MSTTDAIISECGQYRYTLHRRIPCVVRWVRPCLFWMLNPSTADASQDDPTIRRCIGFATAWACSSLTVVNMFALRSPSPGVLKHCDDPIGPDNDRHIAEQIEAHRLGIIVVAWGANEMARPRIRQLAHLMVGVECLGTTGEGMPKHPLYIRKDQEREPWTP